MIATVEQIQSAATVTRGRPLMPVRGLLSVLRISVESADSLIETGAFAFVFDLSARFHKPHRRLLMIPPVCVDAYLAGQACLLELEDVVSLLFPTDSDRVRGRVVRDALNITETLLYRLIDRRELVSTSRRRGPYGSATITLSSITEFLRRRRVVGDVLPKRSQSKDSH